MAVSCVFYVVCCLFFFFFFASNFSDKAVLEESLTGLRESVSQFRSKVDSLEHVNSVLTGQVSVFAERNSMLERELGRQSGEYEKKVRLS